MTQKLKIACLALFLVCTVVANAQSIKMDNLKPNDVFVEGEILDTGENSKLPVEISLYIFEFPSIVTSTSEKYTVKSEYNKKFKFKIKSPAKRFYMRLNFSPIAFHRGTGLDNIYMLESGDRIKFTLSNNNLIFSGIGAAKLQCQTEIYAIRNANSEKKNNLLKNGRYDEYMEMDKISADSILKLRLKIVDTYSSKLGSNMSDIMIANCYGLRYWGLYKSQFLYFGNEKRYQAFRNSFDFLQPNLNLLKNISSNTLIESPIFCDFIFELLNLKYLKIANGRRELSLDEKKAKIFEDIKTNYEGEVREKLITMFFLKFQIGPKALDHFDNAFPLVKNKLYKNILIKIKEVKTTNVPFFPFELESENGSIIKLSDFKNKIVIIDFWFTGCIACIHLAEAMAPIVERYKNNPAVKFVSINIDSKKTQWLKSIDGGQYTAKESINLYLGENIEPKDHPLISKYNITAYPALFILSDEMIFNSSPPQPRGKEKNDAVDNSTKKFIKLIDELLPRYSGL